jgi:hypothetical protein
VGIDDIISAQRALFERNSLIPTDLGFIWKEETQIQTVQATFRAKYASSAVFGAVS